MRYHYGWAIFALIIAGLTLSACGTRSTDPAGDETPAARIEHLEGKNPTREKLSAEAAGRLGIQTATVRDIMVNGMPQRAIPYAAVIYDTQGATWVYMSPEPLTFIREPVTVDDIQGDQAFITDGPPPGSMVVTTGAEELYGAEVEFQEE
jgi:hypothetical protein